MITPNFDLINRIAKIKAKKLPPWALVDADDLAQESIVHALHGRKSIDGPMKDLMRKQGRFGDTRCSPASFQIHKDSTALRSPSHLNRVISRVDIERLLSKLPPRRRQYIQLHYLDGMSVSETAEAMGTNSRHVSVMCWLGMRSLKEMACA